MSHGSKSALQAIARIAVEEKIAELRRGCANCPQELGLCDRAEYAIKKGDLGDHTVRRILGMLSSD